MVDERTVTDFRALCARMAEELDYYRQLLMDDRRETHALATEARAALAQPEPEGPTRRQLLQLAAEFWPEGCEPAQAVPFARAARARWGNHPGSLDSSPQPVPVSERLPGPEDCDEEGMCWAWRVEGPESNDFGDCWHLISAEWLSKYCQWAHWLPAHALPTP